jgi:hypothetical protein
MAASTWLGVARVDRAADASITVVFSRLFASYRRIRVLPADTGAAMCTNQAALKPPGG